MDPNPSFKIGFPPRITFGVVDEYLHLLQQPIGKLVDGATSDFTQPAVISGSEGARQLRTFVSLLDRLPGMNRFASTG